MGASRTAEQPSCDPLSPQGQCRIPQVMGSIPQDRPTPFRPWSSSPGCHLSSWASDRRLQEPPASDLINLLVGLPELRERFTYHITGLLEKDTVQEQPGEETRRARYGKGGGLPCPLWERRSPESPDVLRPRRSPNPVLWEVYGGFTASA